MNKNLNEAVESHEQSKNEQKFTQSTFVSNQETHSHKSWVALIILSLLFGCLGVDRFYAGRIVLGILKLLTGGGFFIWWMIDLILAVTGNMKDSKGLYIQNK